MTTPQDILDTISKLENILDTLREKKLEIEKAWITIERSFNETKDLSVLEEGNL